MDIGQMDLTVTEWSRYQRYLTSVHTNHNGHGFRMDFTPDGERYRVAIVCGCKKEINITEA